MRKQGDKLVYNGNKFNRKMIESLKEGCRLEQPNVAREEPARFLTYDSAGSFIGIYEYHLEKQEFVPYKMFL